MSDLDKLNFNANEIYDKMKKAGDQWADEQAAYNVLDDTKNAVLSQLMLKSKATSVAAREVEAKASPEYTEHVKATQEAMKKALKAKVNYEAIKVWVELKRTQSANERALTKIV